ncbi:MAG: glycosyltransferase family 4 protein [Pirellulaceae bacterium]|nr:glycosyltransferase family 4 protein [Pirellulaceae bacterium]
MNKDRAVGDRFKGLIRFSDPQRMRILRCIATSPYVDPRVAAEMGVPVEMGKHLSVRRAALECDVLLTSGPAELAYWLQGIRPKLCVFVAHGECQYTQRILDANASVLDHVVAVSGRAQQVCEGVPSTVILNGVDAAHVAQSRAREYVRSSLGFTEQDFVVGFVGRFSDEKRPQAIIEAVAQMPPQFKALLVGWGPLRGPLMDYANRTIPGRYAFAEAGDHLGDYYHAMDSFCMPSATEGFGLVVLEAMLCGKPVIVTPVGCVPEVVRDRVNGVVVSGDCSSLIDAISLLEQHPTWAQSIANEGRAYAERNGHALRMARDYQELLTRLWREQHGSTMAV